MSDSQKPRENLPQINITTHGAPDFDTHTKQLLDNIKKCTQIYGIRRQTQKLAEYWKDQFLMDEMIVDIKDLNYLTRKQAQILELDQSENFKAKKSKFQINLYPNFQRYSTYYSIGQKSLTTGIFLNLLNNYSKSLMILQNWKHYKKQLSFRTSLRTYSSWGFSSQFKLGKPLNQYWKSDCTKFTISHNFKEMEHQKYSHIVYSELKGYQNRLKKGAKTVPGIYKEKQLLKYQDVFEVGYVARGKDNGGPVEKELFKMSAGGSLYTKAFYYKIKYEQERMYQLLPQKLALGIQSKFAFVDGINLNLLPHQLLNRNRRKWLDERSTAVIDLKANFYASGNKVLNYLGIMPYNYIQFWVSQNTTKDKNTKFKYLKNVKFEGELGIGFRINNSVYFDIPLLRGKGNPYAPKLGISLDF